jgi:CRISPR-associated protein Csm5
MRAVMLADSAPIAPASFRVYLLRVGALIERGGKFELAWKQAPRGYAAAARPGDSTPMFAEMAPPRTSFSGGWKQAGRGSRAGRNGGAERLFEAANEHASKQLELHREWANRTGLSRLGANLDALTTLLNEARERKNACLLNLGQGGGFLSKAAFLDTANEDYRKLLRASPAYDRAIRTGLPFPKTRKIVFEGGQASTLAGWALFEIA